MTLRKARPVVENRFEVRAMDRSNLFYAIEEMKFDFQAWERSGEENWLPVRTFVLSKKEVIFN